jgi:hypothetical protein
MRRAEPAAVCGCGRCAHGKTPADLAVLLRKQRTYVVRRSHAEINRNAIAVSLDNNKRNPATRRWQGFDALYRYPATTHLVWMERTASRYTRPRKEPQLGHAMCGSVGAPQFGQVTVWAALAFQFARREWVFAREVLYLGSAIVFPLFRSND